MRYERVPESTRQELDDALTRGDDDAAQATLLSLGLHDPDGEWVQNRCLELLNHPSWALRSVAATCLGHVARIHGKIDRDRVLPALRKALKDRRTEGYAEQAIEDIETFAKAN